MDYKTEMVGGGDDAENLSLNMKLDLVCAAGSDPKTEKYLLTGSWVEGDKKNDIVFKLVPKKRSAIWFCLDVITG